MLRKIFVPILIICSLILSSTMAFIFTRKSARPCIFIGLAASTFTIRGHTSATTASCSSSTTLKATSIASDALVNPLLKTNLLPLFNEINPINAKEAIEIELKTLKENFEKYENVLKNPQQGPAWGTKRVEYDYKMVIEDLEVIQHDLSYSWGVIGHLLGVKNSEELRKVHEEKQSDVIQAMQAVGQSKPLYNAYTALKERQSIWKNLDEAQKRIINSSIKSMESSGVGLEAADREKFNKLQLEAAELSTKFSNNVLDSSKAFKMKLTDPNDVKGIPASALGFYAQNAVAAGDSATAEKGPWLVTLDMPSYLPFMQHAQSRELREKMYRAFISRASSGEHDNAPVIQRILQIKEEMAKMLGFKCHAEKSLSRKMAPNAKSVLDLIEQLRVVSYPAALKDLEEIKEFAQTQGFKDELTLWDIAFWSERLRESKYEYSEEDLRPYFSYENVLEGLFSLAQRLFDITIKAADGDAQVWNSDVRFFKIYDKSGEHIASFYLDPFSRPAEKRGGAWMDSQASRSSVMRTIPVAYLTCNQSPPVGNIPSLMTFREVETLYHEFGHGLQHMLTTVTHAEAAGIANVEWDAVELPSQFMENWCYDKKNLYGFAKHYLTGEPLPLELFEKVKAAKKFQSGLQMMRQLFFGSIDMELYSENYDPYGKVTPFEVQQRLAKQFTVIPPLPEDRFLCSFSHIFAGGYSAGYYSYKWAEVMSADAFAAFEEVGLENEDKIKEVGKRFRDTVLSYGGGKHPSDVYREFRQGRDPSVDALLRHSGLSK